MKCGRVLQSLQLVRSDGGIPRIVTRGGSGMARVKGLLYTICIALLAWCPSNSSAQQPQHVQGIPLEAIDGFPILSPQELLEHFDKNSFRRWNEFARSPLDGKGLPKSLAKLSGLFPAAPGGGVSPISHIGDYGRSSGKTGHLSFLQPSPEHPMGPPSWGRYVFEFKAKEFLHDYIDGKQGDIKFFMLPDKVLDAHIRQRTIDLLHDLGVDQTDVIMARLDDLATRGRQAVGDDVLSRAYEAEFKSFVRETFPNNPDGQFAFNETAGAYRYTHMMAEDLIYFPDGISERYVRIYDFPEGQAEPKPISFGDLPRPPVRGGIRNTFIFGDLREQFREAQSYSDRTPLETARKVQGSEIGGPLLGQLYRMMPEARQLSAEGLLDFVERTARDHPNFAPGLVEDPRPQGYSAYFTDAFDAAKNKFPGPPISLSEQVPVRNPLDIPTSGNGGTTSSRGSLRQLDDALKALDTAQGGLSPEARSDSALRAAKQLFEWNKSSFHNWYGATASQSSAGWSAGTMGYATLPRPTREGALDALRGDLQAARDVNFRALSLAAKIIEEHGGPERKQALQDAFNDYLSDIHALPESPPLSETAKNQRKATAQALANDPLVSKIQSAAPPPAPLRVTSTTPSVDRIVADADPTIRDQVDTIRETTAGLLTKASSAAEQKAIVDVAAAEMATLQENAVDPAAKASVSKVAGAFALGAGIADRAGLAVVLGDAFGAHAQEFAGIAQRLQSALNDATTPEEAAGAKLAAQKEMSNLVNDHVATVVGVGVAYKVVGKIVGNRLTLTVIGSAAIRLAGPAAALALGDAALGAPAGAALSYVGALLGGAASTAYTVGAVVMLSVGVYFTIEQLCRPETYQNFGYLAKNFPESLAAIGALTIGGIVLVVTKPAELLGGLFGSDVLSSLANGFRDTVNGSSLRAWVESPYDPTQLSPSFGSDAGRFRSGSSQPGTNGGGSTVPGGGKGDNRPGGSSSGDSSTGTGGGRGSGSGSSPGSGSNGGNTPGGSSSGGSSKGTGGGPGSGSGSSPGSGSNGGSIPWVNPNSFRIKLPSGQVSEVPLVDLSGIHQGRPSADSGKVFLDIPRFFGMDKKPVVGPRPPAPPTRSISITGVWWFHEDGTPSWIPQEKMDPVAKESVTALYKESWKNEWGIDVDVSYRSGPQSMLRADLPVYGFDLQLDASGQITGDPIASGPGDRPINDDNVAADPPNASGGATGAVPRTTTQPKYGRPLSEHLEGIEP